MKGEREKARGTRGGVAVYIWRQEVQFVRSSAEAVDEGWYKTRGRERASEREQKRRMQLLPGVSKAKKSGVVAQVGG